MELQDLAHTLVNDTSLTDDELLKLARRSRRLRVHQTQPAPWMAVVPACDQEPPRTRAVTAGRFFEAMIQTADHLNLGIGRRLPPPRYTHARMCWRGPPLRHLARETYNRVFNVWWGAL